MPVASMSSPTRVLVRLAIGRRRGARRLGCRDAPPLIGSRGRGPEARAGVRPTCVHGPDRPCAAAAQKVSRYASTSSLPTKKATIPPSARNGPNGTAVLRPSVGPLARDDRGADDHAGDQRDEDRRRHRAPEVEAEHAGELDVAHAHPARVEHGGDEEEPAGRDGRRSAPRGGSRCRARRSRSAPRWPPGPVMRLGMIRWSRSISVIGTSAVTSSRPEDDAHGVVLAGDDRGVERAGRQLDERVARRDRRAAVAAACRAARATRRPGCCRARELRAAARAVRARMRAATRRAAAGRRRR